MVNCNKLTLNVKKSNFVIFCPAQRKLSHQPKIVVFDNKQNKKVALEHKDFVKYLGILIDKSLSWKHHIEHIIIKVSRTVGLIAKLGYFLPRHTLLNMYQALIAPYLTYGLTVWGQACKSYLDTLLKLQKRALRFINFSDHNGHAIPVYVDAYILQLKFVYYESIVNMMFDFKTEQLHPIFKIYLKIYLMFIITIHVLLPLITSIPNLVGYLSSEFLLSNRSKSVECNTSSIKKSFQTCV